MAMRYTVTKANLAGDAPAIVGFWKANFPEWPESKYSWFYQGNVCGPASCWTIRDNVDGGVVGSTGVFPRQFLIDGLPRAAGITGGFGVDGKHRVLGPAMMLQRSTVAACDEGLFEFLYGSPNKRSEPVQLRAGYSVVGRERRLVRVLRAEEYLSRHIDMPLVSGLLGATANAALRVHAMYAFRRARSQAYVLEVVSRFDERFDRLWQRSCHQFRIAGERSSRFLNWRFADCPFVDFRTVALVHRKSGDVTGYITYYLDNNVAHIADLWACDVTDIMERLLAAFLREQLSQGRKAVSVLYFGSQRVMDKLRAFGFTEREEGRKVVAYARPDSPLASVLSNPDNWHFTEADND